MFSQEDLRPNFAVVFQPNFNFAYSFIFRFCPSKTFATVLLKYINDNFRCFPLKFVIMIFVEILFSKGTLLLFQITYLKSKLNKKQKALRIKIPICRSWEMYFPKFLRTVLRWPIYRDDSYFWLVREIKIKAKDLRLTLVTLWKFMAVKWTEERFSD